MSMMEESLSLGSFLRSRMENLQQKNLQNTLKDDLVIVPKSPVNRQFFSREIQTSPG
jgi:hypothetical protein